MPTSLFAETQHSMHTNTDSALPAHTVCIYTVIVCGIISDDTYISIHEQKTTEQWFKPHPAMTDVSFLNLDQLRH